jgi:4-diphosphocytidyl-2C-methyl-D-erythritol kinase
VRAAPSGVLSLRAPAKLNLGLRLLGLRDDGYHFLESIFAPIELWDELEIELVDGAHQIELDVGQVPDAALPPALACVSAGPDNLAFRAAEVFCAATGLEARVRIRLRKAVPAAAGLGGGSSDAATVLTGLAALAGKPSDPAELDRIAEGLGADVPFFLDPQPALVSGIGEIITPVDGLPSCHLVLANPGISLATAEVYRAADALRSALTEPRPGSTMRAFSGLCSESGGSARASAGESTGAWERQGSSPTGVRDLSVSGPSSGSQAKSRSGSSSGSGSRSPQRWGDLLINDLEPAALRLCPPVGRLLGAVREAGAIAASMTGSGATVFGVFESSEAAAEAAERLRSSPALASGPSWVRVSRLIGSDGQG